MLEMIPARVSARPGQEVTFACSFHSNEQLSLEFSEEPPSRGEPASAEGGPPYQHALEPYQMGAKRLKVVAIRAELRSITCTARNQEGHTVGSISSMVYPSGGTPLPPLRRPFCLRPCCSFYSLSHYLLTGIFFLRRALLATRRQRVRWTLFLGPARESPFLILPKLRVQGRTDC